ncbi:MAG: hypothetical protein Ct9H300mP1_01980 [Planctomycetaceae bacterium]|nr:MAG: hypothetical protein Ct9H300mP1_01980 [Planctomycetaceae bacterium]
MVTISPDGRQLGCGFRDGGVRLYRLDKTAGSKLVATRKWPGHKSWIDTLVFDRAVAGWQPAVARVRSPSGIPQLPRRCRNRPATEASRSRRWPLRPRVIGWLPAGSNDRRTWSVTDGKPQAVLKGQKGAGAVAGLFARRPAAGLGRTPRSDQALVDHRRALKTTLPGTRGATGFQRSFARILYRRQRLASADVTRKSGCGRCPTESGRVFPGKNSSASWGRVRAMRDSACIRGESLNNRAIAGTWQVLTCSGLWVFRVVRFGCLSVP